MVVSAKFYKPIGSLTNYSKWYNILILRHERLNCGVFISLDNGVIPHGHAVENGGVFVVDIILFYGKEVSTTFV